ncbi:MAG: RNA polymerase sigma factor [Longicatena sp.]
MDSMKENVCDSIEEIIDVYGDMTFRVILAHMHNEADAQDVLQDVFIKIMKKRPVFENCYKEKAWILQVAMNTCKDHWKYDKLRKHEQLLDQYESYTNPSESLEILPYVKRLPQKYRDVVYLFYYEEYSVREIAEILNKKQATVLTWLNRARKKLKEDLKGSEFDEEI